MSRDTKQQIGRVRVNETRGEEQLSKGTQAGKRRYEAINSSRPDKPLTKVMGGSGE